MKYKIQKGTATFEKLNALQSKINEVTNKAKAVAESLGTKLHCSKSWYLAGGIGALEFDQKPEGYKVVGEKYKNLFFPKVSNKKDLALINTLPVIEHSELNDIIDFKSPQTVTNERGMFFVKTVGIFWRDDIILIRVADGCKFTPNKDMTEIVDSEFIALTEEVPDAPIKEPQS